MELLPGKTNYLIGQDPKHWIQDLDTYGRIEYRGVYKGIDVAWYGNEGQIEYDFLLKPGADPNCIRVRFEGARKVALEQGGDVRIETVAGAMELRAPEVYQEIAGSRKRVPGRYIMRAPNEVAFKLEAYDESKPLVIDPTLAYGTYFGQGLSVTAITTDATGNVYIGGRASGGLPLARAVQAAPAGGGDVYVAKFNPAGTRLLYSTYVGGSGVDQLITQSGIAVTPADELVVAGQTFSTDFPVVNAAQSQGPANPSLYCLPFAFKLTAAGNAFVYSTYLGGNPPDGATGWAVATDAAGDAYVTGEADGAFATTAGVYQSTYGGGWSDAFVVKLGPTGVLLYSTMLGGAGLDLAEAIAVDSQGAAYVAGQTESGSFPSNPPGAVTTNAGGLDVFVAKLSPDGSTVNWLTFLGGTGDEWPSAMVRDAASGALYIAGSTNSADLPTTAGVVQPAAQGNAQGFVASLNPDGMSFGFVTYLGGNREDGIQGLALTSSGLVVGGSASSLTGSGFPVSNAIQPMPQRGTEPVYPFNPLSPFFPELSGPLPASVSALVPDPFNPGVMLASSGTGFAWFRTTDLGATWTRLGVGSGFLWYHAATSQLLFTPANPAVMYAAYPFSNGRVEGAPLNPHISNFLAFGSSDGGATWRALAYPPAASGDWLGGMAVSPTDANTVVEVSLKGAVFRSTDGGASFTQVATLTSGASWAYQAVAGSPDGSIYVGACNLLKSSDFGTTWTSQWLGECVGDVVVSPSNPSVVYATNAYGTAMHLYRSADAGITWSQVTAPPVGDGFGSVLVVAPSNPSVLYVASDGQLTLSFDGGTTWGTNPWGVQIWTIGVDSSVPTDYYVAAANSISDGFAAKLSTDGKTLLWSTYYSGGANSPPDPNGASVNGVAAAPNGDAWIAGYSSPNLPITANAYSANGYAGTGFLARISDATAACSYLLNPTSVLLYGPGIGSASFSVTAPSGCAWTATSSDPLWLWVGYQSSTASGNDAVGGAINDTGSTRTGTIDVNGQILTVTQADYRCTYSVGGNTSVPTSGGAVQLTVTAPAGCPWNVVPQSELISVLAGGSGTGNGTVTLSLPRNRSVQSLTAAVQIANQTVTLQQADACRYSLSPRFLGPGAASGTMSVTANLAACSWTPLSNASWLAVSGAATAGSGSFSYTVQANTTGAFRSAQITLDGRQFTVTQVR